MGVVLLFTACGAGRLIIDGLPPAVSKFFQRYPGKPEPKEIKEKKAETPKKKAESKVRVIPPSAYSPKNPKTPDPNEEFRKTLTGGVEVIWGRTGTIINRDPRPVRIKKILVIGSSRTELKWARKNGEDFGPGESHMFLESNVEFEIYSITGLYMETKKQPKN